MTMNKTVKLGSVASVRPMKIECCESGGGSTLVRMSAGQAPASGPAADTAAGRRRTKTMPNSSTATARIWATTSPSCAPPWWACSCAWSWPSLPSAPSPALVDSASMSSTAAAGEAGRVSASGPWAACDGPLWLWASYEPKPAALSLAVPTRKAANSTMKTAKSEAMAGSCAEATVVAGSARCGAVDAHRGEQAHRSR